MQSDMRKHHGSNFWGLDTIVTHSVGSTMSKELKVMLNISYVSC